MENELKMSMESYADFLIERAYKLDSGSEEESREVENICKIVKQLQEHDKMQFEDSRNERDYTLNVQRHEEEMTFKEKQLASEVKRGTQINPNTIFTAAAMFITGMAISWFEVKGGNITPRFVSNLINRMPK